MSTIPNQRVHVVIDSKAAACEKHGAFESKLWALDPPSPAPFCKPFWSKCPTCDDEMQRENDARDAEIRCGVSVREHLAAARRQAAGIEERFAKSTIWNWQHGMDQQKRVWDWAREFCGAFDIVLQTGRCGILTGSKGTGKTHLAIGILHHVLEKGGTGIYTTVMNMLGRIKATYSQHATETETQVVDAFVRADLLVIDEVGRQLDTGYEHAQFFRILDNRYQRIKPTILVSNMPSAKLKEFLGDAVVDRIREAGGALLSFDWASQRSTKRAEPEGDS